MTGPRLEPAGFRPMPDRPVLRPGCVDVCIADLDRVDDSVAELLSTSERQRANRLVRERDARRWARMRGLLRSVLARYLDLEPRAIGITVAERGKPALAGPEAGRLLFNASRSERFALYAIACDREVGVDIEARERPVRELAIARRAFPPDDCERLALLGHRQLRDEFLRLWVRHEAQVKCLGTGLAEPPPAAVRAGLWTVELELGPGIRAAVAAERSPPSAVHFYTLHSLAFTAAAR